MERDWLKKIEHISQVTEIREGKKIIGINFKIGEFSYQLIAMQNEHEYYEPTAVFHRDSLSDEKRDCIVCGYRGSYCTTFYTYKERLFQHLIQSHSIRLEWLFLPHMEGA